ncbi:GntR family transcriptional regulator [Streptococcus pantholopis]|uniref:GntR family transcriptional regulator n=1 Tax=Streptococcus pantholopis TaxID=1811193 RepID=A0A172Q971_9STRE|nr:GntR family transcriptional regulator [Streptococcus pantholopis]AND79978.1 GntR family transcriptional regulator [Streptococcus pantholopis]
MAQTHSNKAQARYQQVAVGIAERIVAGKYRVGEKIKSRSTLASNFNVSPETARKAINILVDLDIAEVKHGSGVTIISKERAQEFLKNYEMTNSLSQIKKEIRAGISQQQKDLKHLSGLVDSLISQNRFLNKKFPFEPYELQLDADCAHFGTPLGELNLWQATGATIIAIEHQGELLLSPGPYAVLEKEDAVYFIGDELSYSRMQNVFNLDS